MELRSRRWNCFCAGGWRSFLLHSWQIGKGAFEVRGELVVKVRRVEES